MTVERKIARLREILGTLDSALVAFSGGVDSSFLLHEAASVLGNRCIALTTVSPTTPAQDLEAARGLAARTGVLHLICDTNELEIPGYAANPSSFVYFCKDNLFDICAVQARQRGIVTIVDGANLDDLSDHRPGLTAAAEQGVRHPLVEAGFSKQDVRVASKAAGLAGWDRPASPCLSSRFPYGTTITREALSRVAAAEDFLRSLGLRELRVRHHDALARIEVPPGALPRLLEGDVRDRIVAELRRLGYLWVTLDLAGFRSGSLNAALPSQKHEKPAG